MDGAPLSRADHWYQAVTGAGAYRPVGAETRARMAARDGYHGYDPHSVEAANQALGTPAAYYRVMGADERELQQPACLMRLTWAPEEAAAALAALRAELDADPKFEESAAAYLAEFDPARHHLFIAHEPDREAPVGYVRWQCGLSVYPDGDTLEDAEIDGAAFDRQARLILSIYPELFYVRPSYRDRRIGGALAGAIQEEVATHVGDVLAAMREVDFPGPLALVFFAEVESEGGSKLIEAIAQSLESDIAARHANGDYGADVPPIEVSLEHREKQTP